MAAIIGVGVGLSVVIYSLFHHAKKHYKVRNPVVVRDPVQEKAKELSKELEKVEEKEKRGEHHPFHQKDEHDNKKHHAAPSSS